MKHELKILPAYYKAVERGVKNFEIRNNNDRGFQKGDLVILKEISPISPSLYTGREEMVEITYVTNYMQKEGYVVFGFTPFVDRL